MNRLIDVTSVNARLVTLPSCEADSRFRRTECFLKACQACPNYGTLWCCPPFSNSERPAGTHLTVMLVTIELEHTLPSGVIDSNDVIAALTDIITDVRREPEARLLQAEKQVGGTAALFTGMCPHCAGQPCSRIEGKPCRHPDIMRPSLEALGYDLEAMSRELFDEPLQWFKDGVPPSRLNLLGGIFFDNDQN